MQLNWARRLGAVFAAALLLVAVATPVASAEDDVVKVGYNFYKNTATWYGVQGEDLTYIFTMINVGTVDLTEAGVADEACKEQPVLYEGDTDADGELDPGEIWLFRCDSTTPRGIEPLVNTAGATATFDDMDIVEKAETTLYPATIRKKVVRYWDYVNWVDYGPGADVMFPLNLYREIEAGEFEYLGTEMFSANEPLMLWVHEGEWAYEEGLVPVGYLPARDFGEFSAGPDIPRHDNTLFNYVKFDLRIEKSAPKLTLADELVNYHYVVTNDGPASVVPEVVDEKCPPVYAAGDDNGNGMVDPAETWVYNCRKILPFDGKTPVMNSASVSDADFPDGWVPEFGGEVVGTNNHDRLWLFPFTLRKAMFLYWGSGYEERVDGLEDQRFLVRASHFGDPVVEMKISENEPKMMWLAGGPWEFTEYDVPDVYLPGYASITYDAVLLPEGVEPNNDWSYPNVATFDLWVEKEGPTFVSEGDKVEYEYVVGNHGPASVTPMIDDDLCNTMVLESGDSNNDGLLNPNELWLFSCEMTPIWDANTPLVNTVKVWDEEGEAIDPMLWHLGGDRDLGNNEASYTLYPVLIEKDVVLYRYGPDEFKQIDGFEDLKFEVRAARTDLGGAVQGTATISENDPAKVWLSEGQWQFGEIDIPDGFTPIFPGRYIDEPDTITMVNVARFDLAVAKGGPDWSSKGEKVLYTYEVTNTGPAAVTPVVEDDRCDPWYVKGDTDGDGKIDPGEVWVYECTLVPDWDIDKPFTNTVTVHDKEGEGPPPSIGGDLKPDNNVDTFTLYPFVLRKGMFLYWGDAADQVHTAGFEKLAFKVAMERDGTYIDHVMVSEADEVKLFLADGVWLFKEKNVPDGFYPVYNKGITFKTGSDDNDWTHINIAEFDLSVEKKLWWGKVVPGQWIAYKYKVRNDGPASVTPQIADDRCASVHYKYGDADRDGMVDPGETWVYKCKYKVTEKVNTKLVNTVEVWDKEGVGLTPSHGGDVDLRNNTDTLSLDVGWYGCSYRCWRKHLDDWPAPYSPDMLLKHAFGIHKTDLNGDGEWDTLLDALNFEGGSGYEAMKRKMFREAAAALLNEAAYGDLYLPYDTEAELAMHVRRAFRKATKWHKYWKMRRVMKELKYWNGGYCAL